MPIFFINSNLASASSTMSPVIFFQSRIEENIDRVDADGQTIYIETDTGAVFRYTPDKNRLEVFETYSSPDYAPHYIIPYTTADGRLF